MTEEFFIPKLGQTVEEVTIIRWLVEDGAKVKPGQEIVEVQTDKTIFPVEANAGGYLHVGPYKEGDVVPVLSVVAIIGDAADKFALPTEAAAAAKAQATETITPASAAPQSVSAQPAAVGKTFASPRARKLAQEKGVDVSLVRATGWGGVRVREQDVLDYLTHAPRISPVAQKMARDLGVDLQVVAGTGPGGRITKEDVLRAGRPALGPLPDVDVLERVPMAGIRRVIADRMTMSVHSAAHVTLVTEVDASELVALRERVKARFGDSWGFAPGYNDFLLKIVSVALREFPFMNARLNGETVEHLAAVNVGLAVDTEQGLLVPVVRNVDHKSLRQVGVELREAIDRTRQGRALPDDLSGGTFTITNLGMYGVDAFTPIINMPEAAILGVGRILPKAVVVGPERQLVARDMVTLSLSFDHRLTDGAPAARFLQYITQLLEDPVMWMLY